MSEGSIFNGTALWKQWATIVGGLVLAFSIGVGAQSFRGSIKDNNDYVMHQLKQLVEPIQHSTRESEIDRAVIRERVARLETETARQFLELSKQLDALRSTQQQILAELRNRK